MGLLLLHCISQQGTPVLHLCFVVQKEIELERDYMTILVLGRML